MIVTRVWWTYATKGEGGGCAHLLENYGHRTMCGVSLGFKTTCESDPIDTSVPRAEGDVITDCGNCARILRRRIITLEKRKR